MIFQKGIYKICHLVSKRKGFLIRSFSTLSRFKGRMSLWKASMMRALASLTFSQGLGISLEHRQQLNAQQLLNTNIVMELDALSNSDKILFAGALLLCIYEHRKNEGKREKFKHARASCGYRCRACFLIHTHRGFGDPSRHVLYGITK